MVAAGILWYVKTSQKPALSKQQNRRLKNAKLADRGAADTTVIKSINGAELHKFHSVSIQCKDDACAAAKEITTQRFLTKTAPKLPLSNCNVANCRCNYVHFSDRREEEDDRRSLYSVQTELYKQSPERDRREQTGRREDDVNH